MPEIKGKIKDFFESETEKVAEKIKTTPTEKFFIIFLVIMTFSALVLGYLQFKKNIEGPLFPSYLSQKRSEERQKYLNVNSSATEQDVIKLQNQDSDLDGLSDYQEIYIYNTNPYLEDTDGDSVWDKQEVDANTDPNCPTGQNCEAQLENTNLNFNTNASSGLGDMNSLLNIEQKLLSGEVTLKDLGIDDPQMQAQLDLIKSGNFSTSEVFSEEEQQAINSLKNINAQELREELESQGIDKAMLDNISDENLHKIFLEILSQYQ